MLEYSEYKSLVDVLEQSNHDNTYQELVGKEEKVLDTVNRAIKYYRDERTKETELVNTPLSLLVYRFFNVWKEIFDDLIESGWKADLISILNKKDRLVFIGMMCVIASILLYYVEITR